MSRLARDPDKPEPISVIKAIQEPQVEKEVASLPDPDGQPSQGEATQSQRRPKGGPETTTEGRPGEARPRSPSGLAVGGRSSKWQEIIWREWSTCEDKEYAQHLFDVVSNTALGWGSVLLVALSGTLYGLLVGYLLGLIALNWNVQSGAWLLTGTLPLILAWLTGVIGGVGGVWASRRLSWRGWLDLIIPNVYADKVVSGFGRLSISLLIGFIIGLLRLNPFIGIILGVLLGIVSGDRRITGISAVASLIGIGVGTIARLGYSWFGLELSLVTGVCLGIIWGGNPLGLVVSWLGMLLGLAIFGTGDWLVSWLGVAAGFGLGLIPNMLGHGLDAAEAYRYRPWYIWWRKQPSMTKVEGALQLMEQARSKGREIWAEALHRLEQQKEQLSQPGPLIAALQSSAWVDRFVARHALVALGGEAIEPLRNIAADSSNPLQPTAIWLLTHIEQETTNRLGWRVTELLCPDCLARFSARSVDLLWAVSFTYYGCRLCGQSRKFWDCLKIVAVLDTNWEGSHLQQADPLRLNWLIRRTLFDFDQVEIIQATDEEVERFAVQVGNDMDPFRRRRYPQMTCTIAPTCHLSENTLRILRHTLGRVEQLSESTHDS